MFKHLLGLMRNIAGTTGQRLKYGWEHGAMAVVDVTMVASSVVSVANSSQFVTLDAAGNAGITGAASVDIHGHLIAGSQTCSATAGATKLACEVANDAIFRVPVGSGTYARSNRGKLCDLVVAANIQGAAVQVATRGHLQILDGDETNNKWIIARINPLKQGHGNAS